MNKELLAYLGLIGYGLYTIYSNRASGSDMNLEFYARSLGPIGLGGWLGYQNVMEKLNLANAAPDVKPKPERPKPSPEAPKPLPDKIEPKDEEKDDNMTKVDELSISELEQEDYRALTYLAKRLAKLHSELPVAPDADQKVRGVKLLKDLNDVFYEIHKSEAST